ncbi:hypothetical protein [Humibacter albus]|uniref:hypothetical protein n=1 Tax=Humibacter albus TaxID=427754 RepID=UPI0003B7052F|nr:hypothetical protein [Humibacter albus]
MWTFLLLSRDNDTTITVIHHDTGEAIATNNIQPDKTYWRNTQKAPGRWPRAST